MIKEEKVQFLKKVNHFLEWWEIYLEKKIMLAVQMKKKEKKKKI